MMNWMEKMGKWIIMSEFSVVIDEFKKMEGWIGMKELETFGE